MRYFPLFFDVQNARVVVVGGGEEALRKVRLLIKTEARIEVIAPELHPELAANASVVWTAKTYEAKHIEGAAIVISSDKELNAKVYADAKALGIPVNAVDDAALSTFIIPSIVDRDPVVVAIGTEGAAPVLAQHIRAKVDGLLPLTLGAFAKRAAALRDVVAKRLAHGSPRRAFWSDYFFGSVAEAAREGDPVAYELALGDALFGHSHGAVRNVARLIVPAQLDLLTLREQRLLMEADYIVHNAETPTALLEMARRDAVRLLPHQIDAVEDVSGNVLHVSVVKSGATPFPTRDELSDAILRAAS
jgi:uroporphyrin-III C-methyltransferase / precorrin-2 dehydrogenase / sirohydrochlorin ferrochelatase